MPVRYRFQVSSIVTPPARLCTRTGTPASKRRGSMIISQKQWREESTAFSGLQWLLPNEPDPAACRWRSSWPWLGQVIGTHRNGKLSLDWAGLWTHMHLWPLVTVMVRMGKMSSALCFPFNLKPLFDIRSYDSCLFSNMRLNPGHYSSYIFCVGHFIRWRAPG